MKFFTRMKDGGPLSRVHGLFIVEVKSLFSVVLLRFDDGARDAYHTHAFNAVSWVLRGELIEEELGGARRRYRASWRPIYTPRNMFHKVISVGTTWAITFRGPWVNRWKEWLPDERRFVTLTHGRKVVG